jgi:DhnA family fructose-bisphosphate aldolase class Ia
MRSYRLNRLFNPSSGRCLDVAVDHGFFGEPGFLQGIEDMRAVVDTLVAAGPDAIQLTVGEADLLQSRPGKAKPALVLRADVANVYGRNIIQHPAPAAITRALMTLVHDGVTPDAALALVEEA